MTVGKAIETADKLRPNNGFDRELKILWLRQADAGLRKSVVDKSDTTDFDAVGADILYDREQELLRQDAELLLPEPYDSYYAHYLAAQMDAALGETDRYANEMQLASENAAANASARSGGYGNSWGTSSGQTAYQSTMNGLSDVADSLYNQAYNEYATKKSDLSNRLSSLQQQEKLAQDAYNTRLNNYYGQLNSAQTEYANAVGANQQKDANNTNFWGNALQVGASILPWVLKAFAVI